MTPFGQGPQWRVLVLMPSAKDGQRCRDLLTRAGLACTVCADLAELCREAAVGAGVGLLTEEEVARDGADRLAQHLRSQPAWSDLPLVVLAREGSEGPRHGPTAAAMNLTLVERPVRMRTLVSVLRAALRARRHQYEIRDYLAERLRAEEALREADRRKDEFLAMLAHELRNPLAPIRNALEVLKFGEDGESAGWARSTIERQVTQMVRLIDDLLDVSRISRGKLELRREPVELASILSQAEEACRPAARGRGLRLAVTPPARPVYLDADPVRLTQVFSNLLNNACKFTPPGGQVWLTAERDAGAAVVTVRDTGVGIAAELLPRVFEMFTQGDRTLERAEGGLGIGLTLVRRLVEMHGGTVEARSDGEGRGAEFVVRLPAAEAPRPGTAGETAAAAAPAPPRRRILVVDDNVDAATSLATLLRLTGNEVRTAHDGLDGVAAAEAFRPDLILLDVGLPKLNGHDAARRIRQLDGGQGVVLVALTGWGQEEDRRKSREAGFNHHLVKPVEPAELMKIVAGAAPAPA